MAAKGTTCLVTGGAGFIGSHLVDALLAGGRTVRVLDNLSTGRRENLAAATEESSDRLTLIPGDIRNEDDLTRAITGVDIVFHLAAMGSVTRSVDDPLTTHEVNSTGSLKVLLAARKAGVGRVIFAGSSSVYGELDALPKNEEMPTRPISPYGLSKLDGESYCRIFARLYGMETMTLRYFNVFGPRQNPNSQYAAVIPLFISQLLKNEAPQVDGDGEQSRDFTYVDNVVHGNLLAAEAPAETVSGRLFNVACGGRHTLNELLSILRKHTGSNVEAAHREPRPGDVRHSQADISEARRLLGYEPVVTFDEGLERTVAAYRRTLNPAAP